MAPPKEAPQPSPLIGRAAPRFRLPSSAGDVVDLAQLVSDGPAVLFFYPKADTPGCTKEACGFRDVIGDFKRQGVAVLGVSPDSPKAVIKFGEKFALTYPLLADEDHAVAERYGVWREKSMYGRKYMGVARTTFVVARGGKVLHVFENVKPQGHAEEVLAWLRAQGVGQNPG